MKVFRKTNSIKNASGFTLIEVLIAITILSFISFSTYKMIDTNTDTKDRIVKEDRQTVSSLTAIGRLDSDISQMYTPLYSSALFVPTPGALGGGNVPTTINGPFDGKTISGGLIPQFKSEDKGSIIFLTQANRRKVADSKESRYAWVKYSLQAMEPDPDNPDDKVSGLYELVRQTISTNIYSITQDWDKVKPQTVMDRIKTLEFSFWDERTKKYTTSLQELNENKNLHRSIKINLIWIDSDNNEQKVEKVFRVLNPYFNTKAPPPVPN